ncbi:MAG: DUF3185 domain-containing protein [Myxococcota bacterium]
MRIFGVLLNTLGVLALWFGGIPYTEQKKILDVGPLQATAQVEKRVTVPPPVGAGLVGAGTLLLLLGGGRKKSSGA